MDINSIASRKRVTLISLLLLLAVVTVNLIIPMLVLLVKAGDFDPFYEGFFRIISKKSVLLALWNSVKISLLATAISVVFAYFFAYVVEFKLKGRIQRVFQLIPVMPMLVPSITHGIVVVYLFGNSGLFMRLFGLNMNIYGPFGIVLGSFFYGFPISFLLFSQALEGLDGRFYDSARALGAGPARRFFDILLPMTKYAIFSAFSVCFAMIFTDYGVPLSVGGNYPILPLMFYKNVIGLLDFSSGAIYSILLLIPAAAIYLLDIFYFSKRQASTKRTVLLDTGRFTIIQKIIFSFITSVIVLCLLVIFLVPFVENWPYDMSITSRYFSLITKNGKLFKLLRNSLLIAACTAFLGTILSFAAGYIYVRDRTGLDRLKKTVHAFYMVSLAVPGLALGLAFALTFKSTPLYNTIVILVFVNVLHFFGSPYMMTISHFKLLDPNLEDICRSLGAGQFRVLKDVIIPCSRKLLTDVFVYFFTNTMVTISAVSLLYNARTMTLAVQITAFNDQGSWESAVSVALVILMINAVMKIWQLRRQSRSIEIYKESAVPIMSETNVC